MYTLVYRTERRRRPIYGIPKPFIEILQRARSKTPSYNEVRTLKFHELITLNLKRMRSERQNRIWSNQIKKLIYNIMYIIKKIESLTQAQVF